MEIDNSLYIKNLQIMVIVTNIYYNYVNLYKPKLFHLKLFTFGKKCI